MAKRVKFAPKPVETGYVLFDVTYEDGSQRSNRRVPRATLLHAEGPEADVARASIEQQDQEIAEKAGRPRVPVAKLHRSSSA